MVITHVGLNIALESNLLVITVVGISVIKVSSKGNSVVMSSITRIIIYIALISVSFQKRSVSDAGLSVSVLVGIEISPLLIILAQVSSVLIIDIDCASIYC